MLRDVRDVSETTLALPRTLPALAALALLPGAAVAQPVEPSVVLEGPGVVRAAGSFGLVLLLGAGLVYRYGGFLDRSVDAALERPRISVLYGLMAFGLVSFGGGYASSQLARLGGTFSLVGAGAMALVALALASLGFAVVGTLITDVQGRRRPWYGLVLGAGISSVGWLVLPPLGGLLAWILIASFGLGGPTRKWFHTPRRVESGAND